MMKNKTLLFVVGVLSLAVVLTGSVVLGQGKSGSWSPPTQQFPQGNTTAPVDIGTGFQTKDAGLKTDYLETDRIEPGPGLKLGVDDYIESGQNSFKLSVGSGYSVLNVLSHLFLNSNSGSMQFNAPAGQANFSITKGIVLPNYSTAIIGASVPVGTITYNNGDIWLFTGGTNCSGGGQEAFIPQANAQAGRCWVKVGGGTVINNYSSSSVGSVWLPGRGGVYTTSTKASIGQDNGAKFEMVVSGNGVILNVVIPTGGINKGPVNKAQAQTVAPAFNISSAGAVSVPAPFTAQNTLTTQNTLNVQGTNGVAIAPPSTASYSIKNNSGTFGLYNNGNTLNFSVGQDGVVLVKDKIAAQSNTVQVVGSSGNESVLQVGGVYAGTFRPGTLRLTHPNGNETISLKQEFGKTLSITEPGNNKTLKINLDNVLATSCFNVNGLGVRKFLKVDANGWVLCEDVIPAQTFQEFSWVATNHQEANHTIITNANYFCALTGFESDDTIQFGKCNVRINGSNWEMNMRSGGARGLRCTARCFQFK